MKEYRKIAEFIYKNNMYIMYLDSKNKHYFLKKTENGLIYPTLSELVELSAFFSDIPTQCAVRDQNNEKVKFIPKVLIGGVAVTLSLSLFSLGLGINANYKNIEEIESYTTSTEAQVIEYISLDEETKDVDKGLQVDTYLESDSPKYKYIYDMDYLNKVFNYDNVSIDEVKDVIKNNDKISDKYKNLLYSYCDALINKYPNIELRVFYENLKTLEIVECNKEELATYSLSNISYGCYNRNENKIYVLEGYDYQYGTWAYQVIFHEISHCLRTRKTNDGEEEIKIQAEGKNFSNTITNEALNSLFAVSLFDYEEKNVAYQLQSNYFSIMLDVMDNYKLDDYVQHSLSYFAKALDDFNGNENYATCILELIQMQYKDYHSDSLTLEQRSYYPIYDYLCDMYFNKYITEGMSLEEAREIYNRLIEKVTYQVPYEYNIDLNRFSKNFDDYCYLKGISNNVKSR